MTWEAWFSQAKEGQWQNVYLFHGEEEGMKRVALERLQALLPPGLEELNRQTMDTGAQASDIIASCEQLPVMSDYRLVVVPDSVLLTPRSRQDEVEQLCAYIPRIPEQTILVFYCHGDCDMRRKLAAALAKAQAVVAFAPLTPDQLRRWVQSKLDERGIAIQPDALEALLYRAGNLTEPLSQELDKLAAYAQDKGAITPSDVQTLVTPSLEFAVYQMVDAILQGQGAGALAMLGSLLQSGEARIGILAFMTRSFRRFFYVKLLEKSGEDQVGTIVSASRYAVRAMRRQVAPHSLRFLRQALASCVEADEDIKSGRVREDIAVERLICALSAGKLPA